MKQKWLLLILLVFCLVGVSGCGDGVEELLGRVNDLLDENTENEASDVMVEENAAESDVVAREKEEESSADETTSQDESSDATNDTKGFVDEDGHGPDDDQGLGVNQLISLGDYKLLDLPNNFHLATPPDDWRLVEMNDDLEEWEGMFCFDTEDIVATGMNYREALFNEGFSYKSEDVADEGNPDLKFITSFVKHEASFSIKGDIHYMIDDLGSACARVTYKYEAY